MGTLLPEMVCMSTNPTVRYALAGQAGLLSDCQHLECTSRLPMLSDYERQECTSRLRRLSDYEHQECTSCVHGAQCAAAGKARAAWELYLRQGVSDKSLLLLQLIANQCYQQVGVQLLRNADIALHTRHGAAVSSAAL